MDFKTSQKLYSVARMNKYAKACASNRYKTMQLYRYNLRLCQRFYGTLHLFEVMLRNAINEHYTSYFSDSDWIVNQANSNGLLTYNKDEIKQTETVYRKREIYSNDKMVASLTMGFWTKLFSKNRYKEGGKTLLRIFPNKKKERINRMFIKILHIFVNFETVSHIMNRYVLMELAILTQHLHASIIN